MTDTIEEIPGHTRVCPRCGTPAGMTENCPRCGLRIVVLHELPSREQWLARDHHATTAHAGAASGETASHASGPPRAALAQPRGPGAGGSSISALLHPTEPSRLALALVAAGLALLFPFLIVLRTGGIGTILTMLAIILGTIWVGIQLSRARLLGRSVRVDADTFPDVQAIVSEVCETLDY